MGEETKNKPLILYECDPDKNTECDKTGCFYNHDSVYPVCHLTSKKEFAKDILMCIDGLPAFSGPFEGEEE